MVHIPEKWTPWAMLAIAGASAVAAVSNLAAGETGEAVACAAIAAVMVGLFVHDRRERAADFALRRWLHSRATAIHHGGAEYDGLGIRPDTRLRQLTLCVSLVIYAFRLRSRLLIEDRELNGRRRFAYILLTLLLGWWSPWGLVWTPMALVSNLRGGRLLTVAEIEPPRPGIVLRE